MTLVVKPIATFVLALSLALLGGCVSSSFTSSTSKPYPAWRGDVKVLKQLPLPGSYQLIGIVRIEGSHLTSDERMYADMKAQAAERGANAVIPQANIKTQVISSGGERRILAAYAIWIR